MIVGVYPKDAKALRKASVARLVGVSGLGMEHMRDVVRCILHVLGYSG